VVVELRVLVVGGWSNNTEREREEMQTTQGRRRGVREF